MPFMRWPRKMKTGYYGGPVGFGSDGFHYPAGPDGHIDTTQALVVEQRGEDTAYVWARKDSPSHAHVWERNVVELVLGAGEEG